MKTLTEELTELYYSSNGNTQMDFGEIVPKLKAMSEEERKNTIGRIVYCMPSGTACSPKIEAFIEKLEAALAQDTEQEAITMSMKRTTTPETISDDTATPGVDDTPDVDDEVVSTAEIVQYGVDDSDE